MNEDVGPRPGRWGFGVIGDIGDIEEPPPRPEESQTTRRWTTAPQRSGRKWSFGAGTKPTDYPSPRARPLVQSIVREPLVLVQSIVRAWESDPGMSRESKACASGPAAAAAWSLLRPMAGGAALPDCCRRGGCCCCCRLRSCEAAVANAVAIRLCCWQQVLASLLHRTSGRTKERTACHAVRAAARRLAAALKAARRRASLSASCHFAIRCLLAANLAAISRPSRTERCRLDSARRSASHAAAEAGSAVAAAAGRCCKRLTAAA